MLRPIFALAAALLLGLASAAPCPGVEYPKVDNLGWAIKPTTQQPGKAITLTARVRINSFESADDVGCFLKNENSTIARWGLNNMKTKVQKYKKGVDFHLNTGQTAQKAYWEWSKSGAAASTNRVWTLTAKVVLDKNTQVNSYVWHWYCEAIWDENLQCEDHLWDNYKTVSVVRK